MNDLKNYIQSDQILESLYERFGAAVFIPIPKGATAPADDALTARTDGGDWKTRTFGETQTAPYLRELSLSNIGVVFGKGSDRLCGIQFERPVEAARFLADNPKL